MFGKLLFFFVFPKLGISYKVKNYPDLTGFAIKKAIKVRVLSSVQDR